MVAALQIGPNVTGVVTNIVAIISTLSTFVIIINNVDSVKNVAPIVIIA